jgi:hypothetical protein
MMALSIKQPWANLIASGKKTIETRLWETDYRGPLLIVSSKAPPIAPAGCALAIADLIDCRPMTKRDETAAQCEIYPNAFAWVLTNIRPISPFPVKGRLGLYEVGYPPTTDSRMSLFDERINDESEEGKQA